MLAGKINERSPINNEEVAKLSWHSIEYPG